ncbi:hypothetical protein ABZ478_29185 [Streptomyces sp. NPDC005706]|uniref:hypothetical protein n=1 Tax=Streptomyces sp. NPDC005706 TaxID=3157169 RepID=UPI0033E11BA7
MMASTTRRHVAHLAGASVLAAALAFPLGQAAATPAPMTGDRASSDPPAESTPPSPEPPSPTLPPPAPTTTSPSTPPGPTTPHSTPSETSPSPSTTSGSGTPNPTDSDTARSTAPEQPEQEQEIDGATADLDRKKDEVPGELAPSVERLTAALRTARDPRTPPQERDAVLRSARAVSSALEVIGDPRTPPAVRRELTGLVKQVVSTLDAAGNSALPPEDQQQAFSVVGGLASGLPRLGDRGMPQAVRDYHVRTTSRLLRYTGNVARTGRTGPGGLRSAQAVMVAMLTSGDPNTPDGGRKELAQSAYEASSSLDRAGDPRASDEEREKARKELDKQIERMRKKQEEAVSAQGLPDVRLGKAAEVCTNSIFEYAPEKSLGRDLKDLLPEKWNTEGVKDFWKSREKGDDFLDVLTQLRNDKFADAQLEIKRLIPRLADSVPASELFGALGTPALHCLRAALRLDQDSGVESGTWVKVAKEKE